METTREIELFGAKCERSIDWWIDIIPLAMGAHTDAERRHVDWGKSLVEAGRRIAGKWETVAATQLSASASTPGRSTTVFRWKFEIDGVSPINIH